MSVVILDASALLAALMGETGCELAAGQIAGAVMCAVNYSEVLKRLTQAGMANDLVTTTLAGLGFRVIDLDGRRAEIAASLWHDTKDFGLSLADRCCLSLAVVNGGRVLTAEIAMAKTALPIEVILVRHRSASDPMKH